MPKFWLSNLPKKSPVAYAFFEHDLPRYTRRWSFLFENFIITSIYRVHMVRVPTHINSKAKTVLSQATSKRRSRLKLQLIIVFIVFFLYISKKNIYFVLCFAPIDKKVGHKNNIDCR